MLVDQARRAPWTVRQLSANVDIGRDAASSGGSADSSTCHGHKESPSVARLPVN